jgi:amino acid permease
MKKHSNGLAVAAMIYAFVCSPVGLIMSIIAKKRHPDDKKLADAAFIISIVFIILFILLIAACELGELWLESQL